MTLIYSQKILDIGDHGLLALTLGSTWTPPLPAHKFGYARWHDLNGTSNDRFSLCTRRVPCDVLTAQFEAHRVKVAGAVRSVKGLAEWLLGEICDDYLEVPTGAYALDGGCALLTFFNSEPQIFRMVDVVQSTVVWEERVDDLRKKLQIKIPTYMRSIFGAPVMYANGAQHICIYLGDTTPVLQIGENGLDAIDFSMGSKWFDYDTSFAKTLLLMHSRESGNVHLASLEGTEETLIYTSALKKKSASHLATARNADRFVLSHPGGAIEIINGKGKQEIVLRPIPRASSKEPLGVILSPNGRYLVVSEWNAARLVDTEKLLVADISIPDCSVSPDRMHFVPEITYRTDWASTDRGGFVLENKTLSHTPFEALKWETLVPSDLGGQAQKKATKPKLNKIIERWHKPALALLPTKAETQCKSKLYGWPHLPEDLSWPLHGDRPMLLLCQLDLAEIAKVISDNLLPKQGGLLFFIAVDEEGEPLLNDSFNPVRTQVLKVNSLSEKPVRYDSSQFEPEQLISFEVSTSDMPQTDAPIVIGANLSDADHEIYREIIGEKLPDGAAAGHRFGGYPHLRQSNDLEAQTHYMATGKYPADSPKGSVLAGKWRLLLQLDSDDTFMWGTDSGLLYFMVNEGDLEKEDFSRVVALSEGC